MTKKNKDNLGECSICHLSVLHVDDYVMVQDYLKGQKKAEFYYHRKCFRDRLNGAKNIQDYALNLLRRMDNKMNEAHI